jgi:thiopeptide-type bacteriocin biosynthesis protein
LGELGKKKGAALFNAVQSLRNRFKLPRLIAVADGDNRLPVDFDNVLSVDSFVHLVKDRDGATLMELFPGPDELCVTGPEGLFVHELIVPFTRIVDLSASTSGIANQHSVERPEPGNPKSEIQKPTLARHFPPGSEWLYVKLYTGSATADVILREVVRAIVDTVMETRAADRWFFIRYGDPDWHLRLRFHGAPQALQETVLPLFHEKVGRLMERGQIWRWQLDTYEREVERYGGVEGVELAEQLFHADSETVLQLIESLEPGDTGADERWRLTMYGIHRLFDDFGFDLKARHSILKDTRDAFAQEFRIEKNLWSQFSDRFRKERNDIQLLLDAAPDSEHPLATGIEILHQRSRNLARVVAELQSTERKDGLSVSISMLMPSYLHMHANRLLRSAQREQELVIYDLLTRFYESQARRNSG